MVRWAYMMPPAQSVSPTHWSMPYLQRDVDVELEGAQPALADDAR